MNFKRYTVVCGHYGSGKTNLSLNLALKLHNLNHRVTIVDMDVVNPYFRTSEYKALLETKGINVITPTMAGTTLDVPAISPAVSSVFQKSDGYVIFDAGGDDAGASALGRFSGSFKDLDYDMLYVVNKFRRLISDPLDALEILREIEKACRLKATGIVNNSHLSRKTTAEDILSSLPYAEKVSELSGLPLCFTAVRQDLYEPLAGKIEKLMPVKQIVSPPWAAENDEGGALWQK